MNKKAMINKARIAFARMMTIITVPAVMMLAFNLADPDFCPPLKWLGGFLMLMAVAAWSINFGFPNEN